MKFPVRLSADLALGMAARALRARHRHPLILRIDSQEISTSLPAPQSTSRIVWIGGDEPLDLSGIPKYVNALAAAKHHVFLQTDAQLLRRRIHEFQPSSYLRFAIRFDGSEPSHDRRAENEGAYRVALESIRTARLSGFFLCALEVLHSASELGELFELHKHLSGLDLDGFLISAAARTPELQSAVAKARGKVLSRRWARLSKLLDAVALPARYRHRENQGARAAGPLLETQRDSTPESVQPG